ncbi:hypothetical protein AURDEDRAFT_188854 [Auricularia subglabra TFB-10046 SS5]|uniref:MYND-type domain-containing protein n=1 Tax=Auricularia subglabra (strain TFB-10046 / SS5) TaxID=717982 RepID=J0CWI3_AURST|nr:hypothetical protein AURDEDRAFT_188854 [Auricularia subglabra TFB-10046 SS5]
MLDVAQKEASMILGLALSDQLEGRPEKGFGSRRGRWPTSPEQLFPRGPEQTMRALTRLLESGIGVEVLITSIVAVHRPLAFPALLVADNRARLIALIIARLNAVSASVCADIAKIRPPVLPVVRDAVAQRQLAACPLWITMVEALLFGVDSKDSDWSDFTCDYNADLFDAIHEVLSLLERPERSQFKLSHLALLLWTSLPHARRIPRPHYVYRIEAEALADMSDPYIALYHFVAREANRRSCHGPDCQKLVHAKPTPGSFSRCAKCGVIQYCSKECQRADWSNQPFPHKSICRLLRDLFAFATLEMSAERFAAACRAHSFPLQSVDKLISWATDIASGELDLAAHLRDMEIFGTLFSEEEDQTADSDEEEGDSFRS